MPAQSPPSARPVFLGQHILYNRTFDGLQDGLFDGLRIWGAEGTTWSELEPRRGEFDFRRLDRHVAAASARGLDLMYTLGQTPRWASARPDEAGATGPGASAEPADMEDWARYVRAVALRYRGRIAAYEIMNEPRVPEAVKPWSPGFFSGSVAVLAEMTRIAAAAVRQVDPAARIVCPAMDGGRDGLKRLDRFLDTGAGKSCDVIGFHYYLARHSIDELRELVNGTQAIKARHGLAQMPLWDTETGVLIAEAGYGLKPRTNQGPLGKMFKSEEAARLAAKVLVVSHSLGVERTYWFAHDTSWMGSTVADKRLNQLNDFGRALVVLKRWVGGRYLRGCEASAGGMSCAVFEAGNKAADKAGMIYWGEGRPRSAWAKAGYSRVEYLDGRTAEFGRNADPAPADSMPLPGDVVFLACPCS